MIVVAAYAALGLPGAGGLMREFLPTGAGQPGGQGMAPVAAGRPARFPPGGVPRSGEGGAWLPQLR
jgi:hypothetical protein